MCPALSDLPPRLGDEMEKERVAFGNAERYSRDVIARQRERVFNKTVAIGGTRRPRRVLETTFHVVRGRNGGRLSF